MKLAHGAWSFGVPATEAELETAREVMEELERLGAHSADVVARWMRVHGLHGVKGDTEQYPLAGWLRHSTGDPLLQVVQVPRHRPPQHPGAACSRRCLADRRPASQPHRVHPPLRRRRVAGPDRRHLSRAQTTACRT